jgi:outer membrane protein assembly factor BamA
MPACPAQVQLVKPQTIRFDGSKEYTAQELIAAIDVKAGRTYTGDDLDKSAQKLMSVGVFQKVWFKFDGVDLIYNLSDNPELYPVVIGNLPLAPGPTVDAELRKRIPLYHGKVPAEGGMLDAVRQAMQGMLADEGVQANVTAVPAGVAGAKATAMRFRIDSPAVVVGAVAVEGMSATMKDKVVGLLSHGTRPYDWAEAGPRLADEVTAMYAANGYAAARVTATQNGSPTLTNGALRVPFTLDVTEGKIYRLGSVQIASGVPVTMDEVEKLTGERTRYSPENVYARAARNAAERVLKAKGYLDCDVELQPQVDDAAGVVNYTVAAKPGPVYHLGLLKFDNVSDQLRSLLMRKWQMMPGDPFNESYVASFVLAAQNGDAVLQRTLNGVKATYDVKADPQSHDVNVIIRLERQ